MKTRSVDRTSDTHRLIVLARQVRDLRETEKLVKRCHAQKVGCEDLEQRCERLGREVERLVLDALANTSKNLFDGPAGLPD